MTQFQSQPATKLSDPRIARGLISVVITICLAGFATQLFLVARCRLALHRRLGQWGAWLAVIVVVVGVATILVRSHLMYPAATPWTSVVVFVAFDGISLVLFGLLVSLAWRNRQRPAIHGRLMTMAMLALLPPAFGRLTSYLRHDHIEIVVVGLMTATVFIFLAVDALRSHRVQPAAWVPGLFILVVNGITYFAQIVTD